MRVFVVSNPKKAKDALDELLPWMKQRVDVVGVDTTGTADLRAVDADVVLALGGDGTLLSAARRLDGKQIPLMGVNFGRLGFLASFSPANFKDDFEKLLAGTLPTSARLMLEIVHEGAAGETHKTTALNDAVVTAGAPFH